MMAERRDSIRSLYACERCRRRKKKCDRKLPKCSHCDRARTACVSAQNKSAYSSSKSVAELEVELADLERSACGDDGRTLRSASSLLAPEAASSGVQTRFDDQLSNTNAYLTVLEDLNTATVYDDDTYHLGRMLQKFLRVANHEPDITPKPRFRRMVVAMREAAKIPQQLPYASPEWLVVCVDNYFNHLHPVLPFLDEVHVRQLAQDASANSAHLWSKRTVVLLTAAIDAFLPCPESMLDTKFATNLWLTATAECKIQDTSLTNIHILLLFTIYSLFDSSSGSSWHLIDLAMQACINMGAHYASSTEERVTFKVAFILDRLISSSLGLPVALQNHELGPDMTNRNTAAVESFGLEDIFWQAKALQQDHNIGSDTIFSEPQVNTVSEILDHQDPRTTYSTILRTLLIHQLRMARGSKAFDGEIHSHEAGEVARVYIDLAERVMWLGVSIPWVTGYGVFRATMLLLRYHASLKPYQWLMSSTDSFLVALRRVSRILVHLELRYSCLKSYSEVIRQVLETLTGLKMDSNILLKITKHTALYTETCAALQAIQIQYS